MSKFIRLTNRYIDNLIVRKSEEVGNGYDSIHDDLPYPFGNGEFKRILRDFLEKTSYSLVSPESLHHGEYVVLHCSNRSVGNLLSKVLCLTLAHSEQSLALLENHLDRPSHGVYPVSLKEVKLCVCSNEATPFTSLAPAYEEQAARNASKSDISRDVPASELTAVLLVLLVVELPDKSWSGKFISLEAILRLAMLSDLYTSKVVALDMSAVNKPDDALAGKPAVSQDIIKTDAFTYGTLDHIYGQGNLVSVIFLDTLTDVVFLLTFRSISLVEFLLGHAVVAVLPLLSNESEVKEHLAYAVGNTEEEPLVAEDAPVLKMGVHSSDVLYLPACLGKVCVINHKTCGMVFMVRANFYLRPQLEVDVVHKLAPVDADITEELVEHVFLTTHQVA